MQAHPGQPWRSHSGQRGGVEALRGLMKGDSSRRSVTDSSSDELSSRETFVRNIFDGEITFVAEDRARGGVGGGGCFEAFSFADSFMAVLRKAAASFFLQGSENNARMLSQ